MHINIIKDSQPKTMHHLRDPVLFIAPQHPPFAAASGDRLDFGIVVERIHKDGTLGFHWYSRAPEPWSARSSCRCAAWSRTLPPVYQTYCADEQARACPDCGTLHPGKG